MLTLISHDRDFFIELDREELMSTRRTGSETALATIGCATLPTPSAPRVLIGGLGLGYTLRTALALLPNCGRLVVAELFPQVVDWNQTHLRHLYGTDHLNDLDDRRLDIQVRDVWDAIADGHQKGREWDAILLDTDNGPEAFCLDDNDRLYGRGGLERLFRALKPGGTLAIWCADTQTGGFDRHMRRAGFETRREIVRERGSKGHRYGIFVGEKPESRRGRAANHVSSHQKGPRQTGQTRAGQSRIRPKKSRRRR